MNTAVINLKVSPGLKAEAQSLAKDLGFSLSALIHSYLKQVVRTRIVVLEDREVPSDYLIQSLKESAEDIKAGRIVSFENGEKTLKYLDKLIDNDKKSRKN